MSESVDNHASPANRTRRQLSANSVNNAKDNSKTSPNKKSKNKTNNSGSSRVKTRSSIPTPDKSQTKLTESFLKRKSGSSVIDHEQQGVLPCPALSCSTPKPAVIDKQGESDSKQQKEDSNTIQTLEFSFEGEDKTANTFVSAKEGLSVHMNSTMASTLTEDNTSNNTGEDQPLNTSGVEQVGVVDAEKDTTQQQNMMDAASNSGKKQEEDSVIGLLQRLELQMKQMKTEIKNELKQQFAQHTQSIEANTQAISKVTQTQNTDNQKRMVLEGKVQYLETKLLKFAAVMEKQNAEIEKCKKEMEDQEIKRNKAYLYIFGLEQVKEDNAIQKVKDFFRDILKIQQEIPLLKAYKRWDEDKWVVAQFKNIGDKGVVYGHVKNLKGVKNGKNKSFQVKDMLPTRVTERRRRNKEILTRNKKATVAQRIGLSLKKGELLMDDGRTYAPAFHCATRLEAAMTTPNELLEMGKIKVVKGDMVKKELSEFVGYVADVNNIEEANMVYKRIRYEHIQDEHLICAVRTPAPLAVDQELFYDDEDHGMGRVLLDYMKEAEIRNRIICVSRNMYGGHIGEKRFDAIVQAAKLAMNKKPLNEVLKTFQFSWPARGGRGGHGRGRSRLDTVINRYGLTDTEKFATQSSDNESGGEGENGGEDTKDNEVQFKAS